MKLTAAVAFEDAPNLIKFLLLSSLFFSSSVNLIWVSFLFFGERNLSHVNSPFVVCVYLSVDALKEQAGW